MVHCPDCVILNIVAPLQIALTADEDGVEEGIMAS